MPKDRGGAARARLTGARRARRLAVSGIAVLAATLLVGTALTTGARAAAVHKVPFQRGITVGEWGRSAYNPASFSHTIRHLKRTTKNNSVTLFPVWMMSSPTATDIHPTGAVSRANLVAAIRAAKKRNDSVILRPYLDVADGSWRGEIHPASVAAWFASYRRFILKYAKLAQNHGVDGLVIESELNTMERYTSRWNALIRAVRKRFTGFLTAQSNWDAFQSAKFWGKLDAIGISAYFPLLGPMANCPTSYSVADLVGGWQEWYNEINQVHETFNRPVLFTELGYTKDLGAPCQPWDTKLSGPTSTAYQAEDYEAAFEEWYKVPWFRGFGWWYVPDQPSFVRGTASAKHVPAKPARAVIRRWYRNR